MNEVCMVLRSVGRVSFGLVSVVLIVVVLFIGVVVRDEVDYSSVVAYCFFFGFGCL